MIEEAESLLLRASKLESIGRYQLEAALQSAHVHRRLTGHNNWAEVVHLYDGLVTITDSPVVAINRALAIAELDGPHAATQALKDIAADARLTQYQPYWAARAEVLSKAGAYDEAREAYDMAIGLEHEPAVRTFLQKRQAALPTH
jgi:RNA polymerase sigma-70 factor (ECF subfamily)